MSTYLVIFLTEQPDVVRLKSLDLGKRDNVTYVGFDPLKRRPSLLTKAPMVIGGNSVVRGKVLIRTLGSPDVL